MLAAIRPGDWDLALFAHIAGAMLLVGALVVALAAMTTALRRGDDAAVLTRLAFRSLLLGVIPAYVVMRAGAQWVLSREGLPDDLSWLGIGFAVSDSGLVLLLLATGLAWWATRRPGDPGGRLRAAAVVSGVLLVAYVVAIWAMTAKPA
jgi:hypothetical protein